MEVLAYIIWVPGALFCGLNFYISFLRYPVHKLLGRSEDSFQWVSGVPLLGTLLVFVAFILLSENPLFFWSSILLVLIDTGGPLWFAGSVLYQKLGKFNS
ncbi:hypothetical protein ACFL4M_03220 [Pseudomonadota bacterium]